MIAVGPVTAGTELSGLAASESLQGLLWTQADDGGADVFSLAAESGGAHGTLHLAGADPVDWEDLAVAPCSTATCIYIADTGDNDLTRATIAVFEVVEPTQNPVGARDTAWRRFELAYPDRPHDMEALFVDPRDGTSYGITKVDAGPSTVFQLPRIDGQRSLAAEIATFTVPSGDTRVTAADLAIGDCGVRLGIRTRDHLFELRGAADTTIAELFSTDAIDLVVADEAQGEGFAYAADLTSYFTIGEAATPTLWRVDLQ